MSFKPRPKAESARTEAETLRYFEYRAGGQRAFRRLTVRDNDYIFSQGKIGDEGETTVLSFRSAQEALDAMKARVESIRKRKMFKEVKKQSVGSFTAKKVGSTTRVKRHISKRRSLKKARSGHAGLRLDDGRVFVLGGEGLPDRTPVKGTELWDPAKSTWSPGPPLPAGRLHASATLVDKGSVLVVGGQGQDLQAQSSVWLWHPNERAFQKLRSLPRPREAHRALLLADGRVLLSGGLVSSDGPHMDAQVVEVWDPRTKLVTSSHSHKEARFGHTISQLASGRVVVIGGSDSPASAESCTPKTLRWSSMEAPHEPREGGHAAVVLDGSRILLAGGFTTRRGERKPSRSVEIWSKKDGWRSTGKLSIARANHRLHCLSDGSVVAIGGGSKVQEIEIWDPQTEVWSPAGEITEPRSRLATVQLSDDTCLLIGGTNIKRSPKSGGFLSSCELWSP